MHKKFFEIFCFFNFFYGLKVKKDQPNDCFLLILGIAR